MYRIQTHCYFHTFRQIHRFSVRQIDTKAFFQRRTSIGEAVLDHKILRFFSVDKRRNIGLFSRDDRLHIFHAEFFKIFGNLLTGARCDFVNHRPWERNRFFIAHISCKT